MERVTVRLYTLVKVGGQRPRAWSCQLTEWIGSSEPLDASPKAVDFGSDNSKPRVRDGFLLTVDCPKYNKSYKDFRDIQLGVCVLLVVFVSSSIRKSLLLKHRLFNASLLHPDSLYPSDLLTALESCQVIAGECHWCRSCVGIRIIGLAAIPIFSATTRARKPVLVSLEALEDIESYRRTFKVFQCPRQQMTALVGAWCLLLLRDDRCLIAMTGASTWVLLRMRR
jgi:hypothetical protein